MAGPVGRGKKSKKKNLRDIDGSEYEVDFMFDTVDVSKILFLRNAKSDSEAIYAMFKDRWRKLRAGSPNEDIENPVINVFVSEEEKGADSQALIDLLLAASANEIVEPADAQEVEPVKAH